MAALLSKCHVRIANLLSLLDFCCPSSVFPQQDKVSKNGGQNHPFFSDLLEVVVLRYLLGIPYLGWASEKNHTTNLTIVTSTDSNSKL